MVTSHRQASTTDSGGENHKAKESITATWCTSYFFVIILSVLFCLVVIGPGSLLGDKRCYLDLFAHSVSVVSNTNANVSTADWSFGFTARSPVTGCKISLHRIKSSLLRGKEVISESSPSLDLFGQFVASYETDWPVKITNLGFNNVVTPEVNGDVVWNIRVVIVAGINNDVTYANGNSKRKRDYVSNFFMVNCGDIPVKFTADSTGNVTGSLLGNMRRCNYKIVDNLDN